MNEKVIAGITIVLGVVVILILVHNHNETKEVKDRSQCICPDGSKVWK